MNKVAAKRVWIAVGLPTPDYAVVDHFSGLADRATEIGARLGWPLVVKPNSAGSSLGLTIARDDDALLDGITTAMRVAGPDRSVLVEAFKPGIEVTVGVLGVRKPVPLPIIEIEYGDGEYDFEAKYTAGRSRHVIPARLPEAQTERARQLAVAAHHAIDARGLSRVDMMCQPDGSVWLLELNTLPGMTALSLYPDAARAAGINFNALVQQLIDEALAG
jgi:D-alanine-D-alanine ligase